MKNKSPETARRLAIALSTANIRQQDLADASGVNKASISQYLSGSHAPSNISSGKMAKVLGVSPLWLMGFEVPMKDTPSPSLPSSMPLGSYKIPVIATVAAGKPIFTEDSILEYIDYPKDGNGQVFAMYIQGDSMEPKIHNGDLVIVDQSAAYGDGDIVVVSINGYEGCCKRIKTYKDSIALISLNSAYEPLYFSKEECQELPVRIIGRVVESRSRF